MARTNPEPAEADDIPPSAAANAVETPPVEAGPMVERGGYAGADVIRF